MSKAEKNKHTLWLREGDFKKLQEMFPDIGASAVVRRLVERYVDEIESKVDKNPNLNIKVDL